MSERGRRPHAAIKPRGEYQLEKVRAVSRLRLKGSVFKADRGEREGGPLHQTVKRDRSLGPNLSAATLAHRSRSSGGHLATVSSRAPHANAEA